jgi:EAL domain-containing protein (putative c-di-GMP-specific phosphodiesterase class I)
VSRSSAVPKVSIHDIFRSKSIVAHFQPILSARRKSLVGFEALARGVVNVSDLVPPLTLFDLANQAGIADDVDVVCREQAVSSFSRFHALPSDLILFLNLRVSASRSPTRVARELSDLVTLLGLRPGRVGLEILESAIQDVRLAQSLAHCLRQSGFLIVLDDVGSGHSNLDRIPLIKPDLLKVDRALVSRIDTDFHKRSTFKSLVDLGRKIGSLVVAEGVETEDEAMIALELGADLLQGYFVGRPRQVEPGWEEQTSEALNRIESVAKRFRHHMVQAIHDRRLQHQQFSEVLDRILGDLIHARPDEFDAILARTIGEQPNVECVYVLDHSGIQVTETVWNPHVRRREAGALFHPAPKGADHSLKEYYYVLLDVELRKYTTEPYVSLASGSVCRTISTYFRDRYLDEMYLLCIDVAT